MKACIAAYTFYETDFRVRRYAEALVERGDQVDVVALKRKPEESFHEVVNGVNVYRVLLRRETEKGPLGYFLRIMTYFILGGFLILLKHLTGRYRIIHVHNVPDSLVFMGLIPKLLGARLILDIHDVLPEFFCQKFGKSPGSAMAKLLVFVEGLSVHFADHVIIANDLWREKIRVRQGLPQSKITTLLNYPSRNLFTRRAAVTHNGGPIIIYPGTISHHHGIDIAVRAVSEVRRKHSGVRFDIYAQSVNEKVGEQVWALINELGLQEHVRILDPVPIEKLSAILAGADLAVVPKRGGVFAGEAFSTKILEFMSAGIPVIASRTRIDEYYFDDSILAFFEPENHGDLAARIVEIHEDKAKADTLVENALKYVDKNNWETKKSLYFAIVDQLTK